MSIKNDLQNLTDLEMLHICDTYTSAQDYLRSIGVSGKGQYGTILNSKRKELLLEWKLADNRLRDIVCPICSKKFKPKYKKQVTCSHSCSNTFFRSGENNPNYKYGNEERVEYRRVCFTHNKKECIICGESNIVAVHHYDEDHNNNSIDNLVPLCPTHHQYMHSRYKYLIEDRVKEWLNDREST